MEVRKRYGRGRASRGSERQLSRLTHRAGLSGQDYAWIGKAQSGDQLDFPHCDVALFYCVALQTEAPSGVPIIGPRPETLSHISVVLVIQ